VGVGERAARAIIDPRTSGVIVRGSLAKRRKEFRAFGGDSSGVVAIIPELHIGDVTLNNVLAVLQPATKGAAASRADVILGFDVLRRLAPTFDPGTDTVTLRRTGAVGPNMVGTRLPMLLDDQGLRFVVEGRWETPASKGAAEMLSTRRWTLDTKRGVMVLE